MSSRPHFGGKPTSRWTDPSISKDISDASDLRRLRTTLEEDAIETLRRYINKLKIDPTPPLPSATILKLLMVDTKYRLSMGEKHWGPPNYHFMEDQLNTMESIDKVLKGLKNGTTLDARTMESLDPGRHAGSDWLRDAEIIWRTYK